MQLDTVMSQGNNICLLIDMSGRREEEMRGKKEQAYLNQFCKRACNFEGYINDS